MEPINPQWRTLQRRIDGRDGRVRPFESAARGIEDGHQGDVEGQGLRRPREGVPQSMEIGKRVPSQEALPKESPLPGAEGMPIALPCGMVSPTQNKYFLGQLPGMMMSDLNGEKIPLFSIPTRYQRARPRRLLLLRHRPP